MSHRVVVGRVREISEKEIYEAMLPVSEKYGGFAASVLGKKLDRDREHSIKHKGAEIEECQCGKQFCTKCLEEDQYLGIHTCRMPKEE